MVSNNVNGVLSSGQASDLASKSDWAWSQPERTHAMGLAARKIYEKRYAAETSYQALVAIYEEAIQQRKRLNHAL